MLQRLMVTLALAVPLFAQGNKEWTEPFPPFRMIGNIYWVGTKDLSTYLITTPQGHILINTGFPSTLPLIREGVEKLGFQMKDVKILTATHAHGDHVAAMAGLKRMTGAKMMLMEGDVAVLESGGKADFRWGDDASARFEPLKVDVPLKDGGKIALGGTELTAHLHAGHTQGATSFTLNVREGGKTYRVGIMNMGSINPGVKVSGMPKFPGITEAYAKTYAAQKAMAIDVFLASHALQFQMHDKYKPGDPYKADRFVDPQGFRAAVEKLEKIYRDQLASERK